MKQENLFTKNLLGTTLDMPQIFKELGAPGISLPTSSPYNTFSRYFVNPQLEAGQRNTSSSNVTNENICKHQASWWKFRGSY